MVGAVTNTMMRRSGAVGVIELTAQFNLLCLRVMERLHFNDEIVETVTNTTATRGKSFRVDGREHVVMVDADKNTVSNAEPRDSIEAAKRLIRARNLLLEIQ